MLIYAKSNEVKGVLKSFKNQVSKANIVKKELDTRTFPEICASLSNAEWLAIRDRCVIQTWACWAEIENPKDKFNAYLKAAEFVMPKMASVEGQGDKEVPDWMKKLDEIRGK
jgi:hypothetical protein